MADQQCVAVAGATGFVGRNIVRELVSRGRTVRALTRSREKAREALRGLPQGAVRQVEGDSTDAAALAELVKGATACINAIGIIREAPGGQTFRKCHVDTTRALVRACEGAQVRRYLHVSALGTAEEGRTAYQRTKFEAEQIVRRSDLAWTILRPSLIHGHEGEFIRTARGWVTGHTAPWMFIPYFTRGELTSDVPLAAIRQIAPKAQPVAVEDVAWAAAECLERSETVGEVYNLPGPETLTWPEMLEFMRDTVPGGRADLNPVGIPREHGVLAARAAGMLGVGALLPFDEGMAVQGGEDSTGTLAKAREHLGFNPRPFRPAFRQYAGRIR